MPLLSDTELVAIGAEFRDDILGGATSAMRCAMVCYPLAGYLSFLGQSITVQETLVGNGNHVWLLLPDGRVLDPTADQFDATLPPVYLGPRLAMHTAPPTRHVV
jgi:hypothetical protein